MSNGQKYPFNVALSEMINQKAEDDFALSGRLLPAHVVAVMGQIVTVRFDIYPEPGVVYPSVTIPIATFPYVRYPVQVGDKGVTLCAQVSLANQTGMGKGLPTRAAPPSLAALYFMPLAHVDFFEVDPNKIVLYGPDGAILRTEGGESSITVDKTSITEEAPEEIRLRAANIYLNGVIHLNGPIQQDAAEIPGDTTAKLIGPVEVEQTVQASDVKTDGVDSLNAHNHDVENVEPGSATRTSKKPNKGS